MAEKKRHTKRNVRRLKAQTTFIRATNGLLMAVILIVGALILCLSYLPQKIAYEKKQGELVEARQREEQAESQLDYLRVKLEAIKHDPAYLEIQARDRLQVYRPGETIFRIER
jgi:cell division protein FtsB